jgi:hypothetical protein
MGLVDLRTNLKSLRYGKDKIGGGSSNQPYIKTDIPDSFSDVGQTGGTRCYFTRWNFSTW